MELKRENIVADINQIECAISMLQGKLQYANGLLEFMDRPESCPAPEDQPQEEAANENSA